MKKKLQRLSSALVATCMLATAAPIAMAASGFEGHWAQATLEAFADSEYLKGNYDPDDSLTRAQFADILNRAAGQTGENAASSNEAITRQDAVVMVARQLGLADNQADLTVLDRFSDSGEISAEARQSVAAMVAAGYVNGTDSGKFLPNKQLTCAEGVTILNNALGAPAGFERRDPVRHRDADLCGVLCRRRHQRGRLWHRWHHLVDRKNAWQL